MINVDRESFYAQIKSGFKIAFFNAKWCRPCVEYAPILENVATDLELDVISIDVDLNESLCETFGVTSIPTIMIFNDGKIVDSIHERLTKLSLKSLLKSKL